MRAGPRSLPCMKGFEVPGSLGMLDPFFVDLARLRHHPGCHGCARNQTHGSLGSEWGKMRPERAKRLFVPAKGPLLFHAPAETMNFSEEDRATLHRLMQWRRDVRHFRKDAIPEALCERLQEAMALAPSVGNARPWRVLRVESAHLRQAVHDNFLRANAEALDAQSAERQAHYRQLKLEGIRTAPLQLAVFTDTDPAEGHGLGRRSMPETLQQSTAMAVQNLNLMARAWGLGVGMVSILDPDEMAQIFSVPPGWHFSLYLCIGWPEFHDDQPLLHRNGWQENVATGWDVR